MTGLCTIAIMYFVVSHIEGPPDAAMFAVRKMASSLDAALCWMHAEAKEIDYAAVGTSPEWPGVRARNVFEITVFSGPEAPGVLILHQERGPVERGILGKWTSHWDPEWQR